MPPELPKQFGLANSIDCRSENDLLIGELTNWRVQKVSLKNDLRSATSSRSSLLNAPASLGVPLLPRTP